MLSLETSIIGLEKGTLEGRERVRHREGIFFQKQGLSLLVVSECGGE